MNPKNTKILMKSKKKLTEALFTVMKQYTYKEITITQIAQEAGLSRKTFYRLYTSKEDILNEYIETVFGVLSDELQKQGIHHYWEVVQLYFDFWEKQKDLLFLFQKNNLLHRLFEYSYQRSMEVFEFVRSKDVAASFALPLPYMLAYSVGGMHSMLLKWVENGMDVSSLELVSKLKTGFMSDDI